MNEKISVLIVDDNISLGKTMFLNCPAQGLRCRHHYQGRVGGGLADKTKRKGRKNWKRKKVS